MAIRQGGVVEFFSASALMKLSPPHGGTTYKGSDLALLATLRTRG